MAVQPTPEIRQWNPSLWQRILEKIGLSPGQVTADPQTQAIAYSKGQVGYGDPKASIHYGDPSTIGVDDNGQMSYSPITRVTGGFGAHVGEKLDEAVRDLEASTKPTPKPSEKPTPSQVTAQAAKPTPWYSTQPQTSSVEDVVPNKPAAAKPSVTPAPDSGSENANSGSGLADLFSDQDWDKMAVERLARRGVVAPTSPGEFKLSPWEWAAALLPAAIGAFSGPYGFPAGAAASGSVLEGMYSGGLAKQKQYRELMKDYQGQLGTESNRMEDISIHKSEFSAKNTIDRARVMLEADQQKWNREWAVYQHENPSAYQNVQIALESARTKIAEAQLSLANNRADWQQKYEQARLAIEAYNSQSARMRAERTGGGTMDVGQNQDGSWWARVDGRKLTVQEIMDEQKVLNKEYQAGLSSFGGGGVGATALPGYARWAEIGERIAKLEAAFKRTNIAAGGTGRYHVITRQDAIEQARANGLKPEEVPAFIKQLEDEGYDVTD